MESELPPLLEPSEIFSCSVKIYFLEIFVSGGMFLQSEKFVVEHGGRTRAKAG